MINLVTLFHLNRRLNQLAGISFNLCEQQAPYRSRNMLKHFFNIMLRNLVKHKGFSFISIAGLAIGLAAFILISLWVQNELSYDRYHEKAGEIYRLIYKNGDSYSAVTHFPLANALKASFPEVENAVRIEGSPQMICRFQDKVFYEDRILVADGSLFDIFSFPFIHGDPATALSKPGDIVLTASMAKKYFGSQDALGKTLMINDQFPGTVTGIVEDVPENSHFTFDFLVPMSMMKLIGVDTESWNSTAIYTYILLNNSADVSQVRTKLAGFLQNYIPDTSTELQMQPLTKIYLSSGFEFDLKGLGDVRYVYIFSIIALLILLIASINYLNLETARSFQCAREIGVRKVAGAGEFQLVQQITGESILHVTLAMSFALILTSFALPVFQQMTGKSVSLSFSDPRLLALIGGIILLTGLLSSLYPALVLASFKPIEVLKSSVSVFSLKRYFSMKNSRRILVIFQFTCSVLLVIATLVISRQLNYIHSQKLGFDSSHVVYFPLGNAGDKYNLLRQELINSPVVQNVALAEGLPTAASPRSGDIHWAGQDETHLEAIFKYADADYLKLLNTEFAAGRNFSRDLSSEGRTEYILNETAINRIGIVDPIGKQLSLNGNQGTITGIIEDAHFRSFHHAIDPMIFRRIPDTNSMYALVHGMVYIKLNPGNLQQSLTSVRSIVQSVAGNLPPDYHFLDQTYDQLYASESRMETIFDCAALIAIAIACIGLFGLASFLTERRSKEIGLRKVLGATQSDIAVRLSGEFLIGILIANVIAWPIAWYFLRRWLQNFVYRIDLTIWPFLGAGTAVLAIALLTVSWQTIRAATANPVDALRYE